MEFRKKPVVIEAYRAAHPGTIKTLEGDMKYDVGDWIITGVKGERYPCKDDIFQLTYELADSPPPDLGAMLFQEKTDSKEVGETREEF